METIDELLHRDKALESTWNAYLEFLEDPALTPEQADAFMTRLEQEPDAELGYCTRYLHLRTQCLLNLDRLEDAAAAWILGRIYGAGQNGNDWDLLLQRGRRLSFPPILVFRTHSGGRQTGAV